ncbi:MAG: AtpZ/AtpI family protein [Candidatus Limnocylindria bacterium]|nr:AtpZ/AtpI family protein [Candidatus Limnocylindria bacterium]
MDLGDLRALDRRVDKVVFPDEGHGFTKRADADAAYTKIVEWLAADLLAPAGRMGMSDTRLRPHAGRRPAVPPCRPGRAPPAGLPYAGLGLAALRTPGGARSHAAILGQVGLVIAVPIAFGAWLGLKLDEALGTKPWGLLGLIFVGMAVAGFGVALLIKRFADENPVGASSEKAREAGRRWEIEVERREREREAEQE